MKPKLKKRYTPQQLFQKQMLTNFSWMATYNCDDTILTFLQTILQNYMKHASHVIEFKEEKKDILFILKKIESYRKLENSAKNTEEYEKAKQELKEGFLKLAETLPRLWY